MPAVKSASLRLYLSIVLLEGYAILLALLQSLGGVRTDEAKYLLNIPYPHPPLLRWFIERSEVLPFQELFWRLLLATLFVHAVWLVLDLGKNLSREKKLTIAFLWLSSGGLLLQAGSIMMAPVTALQGLVFVWFLFNEPAKKSGKKSPGREQAGWVVIFWLASLFTAYQTVLYVPLVWMILAKRGLTVRERVISIGVPIALLLLYIATNPLAARSFLSAGTQNADASYEGISGMILRAWLVAGSGILSVLGVLGMVQSKRWELIFSMGLLVGFLLVSFRSYYPVLFLPLLIGGVAAAPEHLKRFDVIIALQLVCASVLVIQTPIIYMESGARRVMRALSESPGHGVVLIQGNFGHEWQYESTIPVLRYRPALLSKAKAVVCLVSCPEVAHYGFYQIGNVSEEVWVRK